MKIAIALIAASLLPGCAGMTDIIDKQKSLYAPKAFNSGSADEPYKIAAAAARTAYTKAVNSGDRAPIPDMIDAGIVASNGKCREWLEKLSAADLRWRQGEGNIGVLQGLITGALGAAGAAADVFTVYGLGSAALAGFNANFHSSVLGMADPDMQAKLLEVRAARAREMRSDPPPTYPQAIDALEEYERLCTPEAAKAAARSAMTSTVTVASPAGTLKSIAK